MTPPPRPPPSEQRDIPDVTGESTAAHGPTLKETSAHGGGVYGGPSVTEFGDGTLTHGAIVGGGDVGDRVMG